MIDVEHAQQLRAVQERRRADGVEALLDDGRADVRATRVVAIAHREQRPPGGHRGRRAGTGRGRRAWRRGKPADRPRLTSAVSCAVGAAQEDGRPVGLEQDHRVVHQAGQDPVQVEAAADVAGDAAQGLGAVEQVGDLVLATGDADDRPDGVGEDHGQVLVGATERIGTVLDDEQDAPRSVAARDGDGELGAFAGQDGHGDPLVAFGDDRDGRWVRAP